jgi:ceramide glucosyltransferase
MLVHGLLALVSAAAFAATLTSIAIAFRRLTRPPSPAALDAAPVSIVRPLCGLEPFSRETLESGFRLRHPRYELIFCAHRADDPVVPLVQRLMAAHPGVEARLLIGEDGRSANPKLDNCLKGWAAARHDWIVLADSNVDMPPDYLDRLLEAHRPGTGLVCSMPLGTRASGLPAEVECAFLNGFQARWQYAAEAMGSGYAQGKSMLWSRSFLDHHGGLMALACEAAEDAAATKLVRRAGLRVRLVDQPFPQPIGRRTWVELWNRQVRWARLRRATFPAVYLLECLTSPLLAAICLAVGAAAAGWPPALALIPLGACYGAEFALVRRLGWARGRRSVFAALLRDMLIPAIWTAGFLGRQVSWHGRAVPVRRAARLSLHRPVDAEAA